MQRTMMNITGEDRSLLHLAKQRMAFFLCLDPPRGALQETRGGLAAVEALR